jgi:uncharacterized protein YbbK (DUF523 family)
MDLQARYQLLHGGDFDAARVELERLRASGRPVVAVSACLLGVRCRFDGGDKARPEVVSRVAAGAEILPVCPEVLARFGVPRPAINLRGDKAIDENGRDVTSQLEMGAVLAEKICDLGGAGRALLKERSPSCGSSKIHGEDGLIDGEGRFTARLRRRGLTVVSEET